MLESLEGKVERKRKGMEGGGKRTEWKLKGLDKKGKGRSGEWKYERCSK